MSTRTWLGVMLVLFLGLAVAPVKAEEVLTPAKQKELAQKAVDLDRRAYGHYQRGEHPEALALLQEVLEIRRQLYPRTRYPDGHPDLAGCLTNLGVLLRDRRWVG
jgi:hypothetical protein